MDFGAIWASRLRGKNNNFKVLSKSVMSDLERFLCLLSRFDFEQDRVDAARARRARPLLLSRPPPQDREAQLLPAPDVHRRLRDQRDRVHRHLHPKAQGGGHPLAQVQHHISWRESISIKCEICDGKPGTVWTNQALLRRQFTIAAMFCVCPICKISSGHPLKTFPVQIWKCCCKSDSGRPKRDTTSPNFQPPEK